MSPEIPSQAVKHLRLASLLGVGLVLVFQLPSLLQGGGLGWGFVLTALGLGIVWLMFRWLMPKSLEKIRQHPDLLVPLGLAIFAGQLLAWSAGWSGLVVLSRPWFTLNAWIVSLPISLHFLLGIAIAIAYATWVTKAILNVTQANEVRLLEAFHEIPNWCWRILGLTLIGWAPVFVALGMGAPLFRASFVVALVVIVGLVFLWNLASAALLLVAYQPGVPFGSTLRRGFRASWSHKGRWWFLLVLQMLALGLIFFSASFSSDGGSYNRNVSFSVNTFWIGGYEHEFRWYGKLMNTWGLPTISLFAALHDIGFALLALGIKLHIADVLYPKEDPSAVPPIIPEGKAVSEN